MRPSLDDALTRARATFSNDDLWALVLDLFARFPPEATPYQVVVARDALAARLSGRVTHGDPLAAAWFCAFGAGAYLEAADEALDDVAGALAARVGEEAVTSAVRDFRPPAGATRR